MHRWIQKNQAIIYIATEGYSIIMKDRQIWSKHRNIPLWLLLLMKKNQLKVTKYIDRIPHSTSYEWSLQPRSPKYNESSLRDLTGWGWLMMPIYILDIAFLKTVIYGTKYFSIHHVKWLRFGRSYVWDTKPFSVIAIYSSLLMHCRHIIWWVSRQPRHCRGW